MQELTQLPKDQPLALHVLLAILVRQELQVDTPPEEMDAEPVHKNVMMGTPKVWMDAVQHV